MVAFSADLACLSNTKHLIRANSAEHPKILYHAKIYVNQNLYFSNVACPYFQKEFQDTHHSGAEYMSKNPSRQEKFLPFSLFLNKLLFRTIQLSFQYMNNFISRLIERHPIILLATFSFIFCIPVFINGMPLISSYAHNILLHEGISQQLQAGVLYPRWLPDLYVGYGGASGFYYPPLLYWFSGIVDIISVNMLSNVHVLTCVMYLALFLSGVCFYYFAKRYCDTKSSLVLATLYMVMPYHFPYEILMRNALSEFLAYIWLPIIFLCIRNDMFQKIRYVLGYSLAYTALIFSHLPTALIVSIIIGMYCIFHTWPNRRENISFLGKFIFLSVISIGLASIYLVPALGMLDYMNLDGLKYFDIHNYFIDDFHGPYDDGTLITLFAFAFAQLMIATFIIMSSYSKSFNKSKNILWFLYGLNVFLFFMMTSYSVFIWDNVPLISSIQFSWRLLVMSDFFTLFLMACYLCGEENTNTKRQAVIGVLSYCAIMYSLTHIATYNKPLHLREKTDYIQKTQLHNKVPNPEHIPKNDFYVPPSLPDTIQIEPRDIVSITNGEGSAALEGHEPRKAIISVNAQSPSDVEFRQFMFYNWHLTNLNTEEDVSKKYNLRAAAPYGQMQFSVPSGNHRLLIELEKTPYERIAELLSAFSFCVLIVWLCLIAKRQKAFL